MGSSFSSVSWARLPLSSPSHSGIEEGERLLDSISYGEEERPRLLAIDYVTEAEARFGLDVAEPFDVFVHVLEWLDAPSLAKIAVLSHAWKTAAYDPFLWNALDLSPYAHRGKLDDFTKFFCMNNILKLTFALIACGFFVVVN